MTFYYGRLAITMPGEPVPIVYPCALSGPTSHEEAFTEAFASAEEATWQELKTGYDGSGERSCTVSAVMWCAPKCNGQGGFITEGVAPVIEFQFTRRVVTECVSGGIL